MLLQYLQEFLSKGFVKIGIVGHQHSIVSQIMDDAIAVSVFPDFGEDSPILSFNAQSVKEG